MTLWLSNLAAYSVQLAALVVTGAVLLAVLRVHVPRAALRFWQGLFVASVVWPALQLLAPAGPPVAAASTWTSGSSAAAEMRASLGTLESDVARMILVVLATGGAVRLAWMAVGLLRLHAIRHASVPAAALASIADPLQRELGVTADLRFSDAFGGPATFGVCRPTVLLPPQVAALAPSLQRAVLCHELIHVRRRDWVAGLVEELWCAILWFHPAARALASRLSLARETVVDEATVAHTRDRRAYAAALLEFASPAPRPSGATALIECRHLDRRVALITQEVPMSRSSLVLRLAVAAMVVTGTAAVAATRLPIVSAVHAQPDQVYKPGPESGVTLPVVLKEVKPSYTPGAMQAKIQGTVWLTVIVLADGAVGDVTVAKSLDKEHGLDQAAVDAARQWTFKPGTKDDKPVPVEITVEMTFTLKQ